MKVPLLLLRVLDPAEHYMRKQKGAGGAQYRLDRSSKVVTEGTPQGPQEGTADRTASAGPGAQWTNYVGSAARELVATGKAVVPSGQGSLKCELIHFWVGDAVLKTEFLTTEGKLRTSSVTRIRRNVHQEAAIERRLVSLLEAIR